MSISTGATDMIGGTGYGGFGGGFGGIAPVGLIGLNTLFGRGGFGGNDGEFGGRGNIVGNTVAEQNISELRKDVAGVNTTVEALGNELQGALAMQNLSQQAEFRNLDNRLCDSEKAALQSAYAQSLQAFQNTQAIQTQMSAFQVTNDKQFCEVKEAIHADGDATRNLITQNLIDGLRNELLQTQKSRDNREIEISINNSNAQSQAQAQTQRFETERRFDLLFNQVAKASQDIINVGGILTGVSQTANPVNVK